MMFNCDKCGECCRNLDKSPIYSELDRGDGICRYLIGNLCSIYEKRPMLCRIDESYDLLFKDKITRSEFYKLNQSFCIKLKITNYEEVFVMPLPLILGLGAAAAGALGIGTGIHGAVKMKDANDTMKLSQSHHEENLAYFEKTNKTATNDMDILGKKELEVLTSFKEFSDVFEKIHNRPEFKTYDQNGVKIPSYNAEEIKKVSVGAGVLLGGLGGAAVGTAGGFAAAGATTAAVMALGTASTGTAIASLSGAAATNATLAALGGGALAAGGGGMALGTTILGAATLGVGVMVGGIIFNIVGSSLSNKADEAYWQVRKEREEINKICDYLLELSQTAKEYTESISTVQNVYKKQLDILKYIVYTLNKRDWNDFSKEENLLLKTRRFWLACCTIWVKWN